MKRKKFLGFFSFICYFSLSSSSVGIASSHFGYIVKKFQDFPVGKSISIFIVTVGNIFLIKFCKFFTLLQYVSVSNVFYY